MRLPVSPGWFAINVHALVLMARSDEPCPSAQMACTMNAHAVSLRRCLTQVVRAGIVEAREGRDGGYRLARPPQQITLAEVYQAVKAAGPIDMSPIDPASPDPLAAGLREVLDEIGEEAEARMLQVLARHTLAEVAERAAAAGRNG